MNQRKQAALTQARMNRTLPWQELSSVHWRYTSGPLRVDYWPTTGSMRTNLKNKTHNFSTIQRVEKKIEEMLANKKVRHARPKHDRLIMCAHPYCPNGGPLCRRHDCPQEAVYG